MLTAESIRGCRGESGATQLLRELGYPVEPVDIDRDEWRRGGVDVPWNGEATFRLAARLHQFDLFLLTGNIDEKSVHTFLNSYRRFNIATKSGVVLCRDSALSVFDCDERGALRRLDVDCERPSAHAVDRLNLLAAGSGVSLRRVFDRALDREQVTRQFFLRFRNAVSSVATALGQHCSGEHAEAVDGEALLIMSRLLFLSFIQEKGWLNGERRFLVDRLEQEGARGREFFSGVLLPLFFECLNTPRNERPFGSRRLGRLPYLNGGLFEPSAFERRNPDLHLPNDLMHEVLEGVFEKFDFRIDESDSAGTHVDPEMLGRVFESLMAADERVASGSFYTPKEIVDVLTAEAVEEWVGEAEAEEALARLARITVLDPACGSGAFLLSAMSAIERMWRDRAAEAGVEVPPDLRRLIVERSLYGVDLKPEAVRLCELRLWLAIVSASEATIEEVQPLPNLDRNILQGNSLLSPTDFLGDGRGEIYHQWVHALRAQRELLERYRNAPHAQRPALYRLIRGNDQRLAAELLSRSIEITERELQAATTPQRDLFGNAVAVDAALCRELQDRIGETRAMLERVDDGVLDFFSFDVHFAPVIAAGGFDVVVGNPPWVRNSRIDRRAKQRLADRFALFRASERQPGFHQPDLSLAFFERSESLAAPDGVVAVLMPAKIANAAYAAPLRRSVVRKRVVALHDWTDEARRRRWFEADTFPLGVVMKKSAASDEPIRVTSGDESFAVPARELRLGSSWVLAPPEVSRIVRRLHEEHPTLAEQLSRKPLMGVKTGDNGMFFLDVERLRGGCVVTRDGFRVPLSAVCRCVRGRDLQRWSAAESHWMLWPPRGGWNHPPQWLERLAGARGADPVSVRLSFVRPEHVGIKVAWKDLSRGVAAAVLPDVVEVSGHAIPLVPNQTLYALDAVSLDEAYVLAAVLNSTIAGAILAALAERAKDAHYRYFGRTVAGLPLPALDAEWDLLVRLSRRAHRGQDVAAEIDYAVARLYRVTRTELRILGEFLMRRLGAQ